MGLYNMRPSKDAVLFRIASAANNWGVTPNMLTALGLTLGVACGLLFAVRALPYAFALGFLSVFCDVLDGTLARKFNMETKTGLMFDSLADRAAEFAVIIGALVAGIIEPVGLFAIAGSASLLGMRFLSYRRGLKTDFAMFGRFERLVFILAGLLLPMPWLSTLCFIGAGSFGLVSALQIGDALIKRKS